MPRPKAKSTKSRKSSKSKEPSWGWQNCSLNEGKEDSFYGQLRLTPEFLEEILDRVDAGDIQLNDEGYFVLFTNYYPRESGRNFFWSGNVIIPEDREEDEDDEDEDDEPPRRSSRKKTTRRR